MLILIEQVLFFDESDNVGDLKSEEGEEGVEGGRHKKKKKVRRGDYKTVIIMAVIITILIIRCRRVATRPRRRSTSRRPSTIRAT